MSPYAVEDHVGLAAGNTEVLTGVAIAFRAPGRTWVVDFPGKLGQQRKFVPYFVP